MNPIFVLLLITFGIVFAIIINYICTLPYRRKNEEKLRREFLLYEQKVQAERAKQIARIAGEITRKNIDEIAKHK